MPSTDMHLFVHALPKTLAKAVCDETVAVQPDQPLKPPVLDTCTFNPNTRTLRIRVPPAQLSSELDLAKRIGKRSFHLCLDVSGSMGAHADEMIRILQQVEDEFIKLQSLVTIQLRFFSSCLLSHTPLGELASVCKKPGWHGGTCFKPPLDACLEEARLHLDVEHTVLFMTDGVPYDKDWEDVAKALRDRPNVKVIAVGFGSGVNASNLHVIAGGRVNVHTFDGADAGVQLHGLLQSVVGCGIELPTFAGRVVVEMT